MWNWQRTAATVGLFDVTLYGGIWFQRAAHGAYASFGWRRWANGRTSCSPVERINEWVDIHNCKYPKPFFVLCGRRKCQPAIRWINQRVSLALSSILCLFFFFGFSRSEWISGWLIYLFISSKFYAVCLPNERTSTAGLVRRTPLAFDSI